MNKKIKELVDRVDVFNDSYELAKWLENYREDLKESNFGTEAIYYLEEIRQNLVGQQEALLDFKKHHGLGESESELQNEQKVKTMDENQLEEAKKKAIQKVIEDAIKPYDNDYMIMYALIKVAKGIWGGDENGKSYMEEVFYEEMSLDGDWKPIPSEV